MTNDYIDKNKPFLLKVFHLDGKMDKDIFIDLLMYFAIDNKYVTNMKYWKDKYYYSTDIIYPLKKIKFENNKYDSVCNPIPYLNNGYLFWRDLAIASHTHFDELKEDRKKNIYFTLR